MEARLIGKTIDNYRIIALLGKGGMGVVYQALDLQLDKIVALKMMDLGLSRDESFLKRFRAEARALGKLQDPFIVNVHALRETELGLLLVMEFVDGDTLAQILRSRGPLPHAEALPLFHQILHALEHAHRAGVIHRDLKPNNIMVNRLGTVKVMDFGLAKLQHPSEPTTSTITGGTLHYMSPEQIHGMSQVDHRSDLYSAGMSLYETLTGKTPFDASLTDFATRQAIVAGNLPSPERLNLAIPRELAKIVMKALAQNPDGRFQSAAEMAAALTEFEQAAAARISPAAVKRSGKRPLGRIALAALAAIVVVAAILLSQRLARNSGELAQSPLPSLSLATQPGGATVFLDGDSTGVTPLKMTPARAGRIALRLQKADYFPLDTAVTIIAGRPEAFSFTMRPAAKLRLTVAPPEASVKIDGRPVAAVELADLRLNVGRHDIDISAPGHQTRREELVLSHGANPPRRFVLERNPLPSETTPAAGTLAIKSDPAGAAILLNGRAFGVTPQTAVIAAGRHEIILRLPGYKDDTTFVTIFSGQTSEAFGRLQLQTGTLSVLVKPFGTIYLNGALERQESTLRFTKTLAAGVHRLTAVHPTLGRWEKNVTIAPDEEVSLEIDFNRQATLRVTAFDQSNNPVYASIIVDGNDLNQKAPKQLMLHIGLHTIAVRQEGYRMVGPAKTILLEGNVNEPLRFTLQKLQ
ncbi:serine/threonine protein kinase [candidate division KSB1 bacterium]|nr:PEGA domain-containing protein [bacterium]NUM67517.1 serine/threonine protein kinase [candidate division KSB1 bacterium]